MFLDRAPSDVSVRHGQQSWLGVNETVHVRVTFRKLGVPGKEVAVPSANGVLDVTRM